jgi:hypothetical protein
MKTRTLIVTMCLALLGGGVALAAEVGNNPQGTGWRWDFGFDRSEREVELDQPAEVYQYEYTYDYGPDDYGYERYTEWLDSFNGRETLDKYFLKGAYGFGERYAFYVTVGMASMLSESYDPISRSMYEDYEYYYGEEYYYWDESMETTQPMAGRGNWDPFYGVGFKAVFHDVGGFKVGIDVQWNQYKLDSDVYYYLYTDESGEGPVDDPYYEYVYSDSHRVLETDTTEYQAALVFSKQNPQFSPYGGLKLSQYETDFSGEWTYFKGSLDGPARQSVYEESGTWTLSTKQSDYVGMFLGLDCEMTDRFVISGEIRVGDEKAATVKMSWKF